MHNRTGSMVPTEAQAAKWIADLRAIREEVAPYCIGLTPDERRHTLKFRPGGESIIAKVAGLVRKHNVSLPGINADEMEADLQLAQRLTPIGAEADDLRQLVDDTVLEAHSESWYAATAFYTMLSRLVTTFPDIKNPIAEIAAFFARKRKKPEEPPLPGDE